MTNGRNVNGLVAFLVALALLIFVLLSGMAINFELKSFLFLIVMAIVVYVLFLIVFSVSKKKTPKTEFQESNSLSPVVEYKSPAMEEFDKAFKSAAIEESEAVEESSGEFVGTEESKMYHKLTCRFAKLIKPKYRIEGSKDFFRKKKYKACSVCKPNKK